MSRRHWPHSRSAAWLQAPLYMLIVALTLFQKIGPTSDRISVKQTHFLESKGYERPRTMGPGRRLDRGHRALRLRGRGVEPPRFGRLAFRRRASDLHRRF